MARAGNIYEDKLIEHWNKPEYTHLIDPDNMEKFTTRSCGPTHSYSSTHLRGAPRRLAAALRYVDTRQAVEEGCAF